MDCSVVVQVSLSGGWSVDWWLPGVLGHLCGMYVIVWAILHFSFLVQQYGVLL